MKNIIKYTIPIALLFTACETPSGYKNSDAFGGFIDQEVKDVSNINGSPIYASVFLGNGFTTAERAIDFSLLRCAERAWHDGYNYIVKLQVEGEVSQDGSRTTAFAIPLATGGAVAFGNSQAIYKPHSKSVAIALFNEPKPNQIRSKYAVLKIEKHFTEMKRKYNLTTLPDRRMFNKKEFNIQKNLDENFAKLLPDYKSLKKSESEAEVIDLINGKKIDEINSVLQLGVVNFGEIPFEPFNSSSEEFKTLLKRKSQEVNSNLIIIDHEVDQEESNTVFKELFSVVFCYRLDVKLDVDFDPQANVTKEIKVRKVYREGGELQYGDVILAVNGVDVLSVGKKVKDFADAVTYLLLGKKAGENIVLDIVRNNKPVKVSVKLLENK